MLVQQLGPYLLVLRQQQYPSPVVVVAAVAMAALVVVVAEQSSFGQHLLQVQLQLSMSVVVVTAEFTHRVHKALHRVQLAPEVSLISPSVLVRGTEMAEAAELAGQVLQVVRAERPRDRVEMFLMAAKVDPV
jgi:hypothetical protein